MKLSEEEEEDIAIKVKAYEEKKEILSKITELLKGKSYKYAEDILYIMQKDIKEFSIVK